MEERFTNQTVDNVHTRLLNSSGMKHLFYCSLDDTKNSTADEALRNVKN